MADGKKNEISKDVSAIANSDGGIIIYGIAEKANKADSLSFINGNDYSKEWLEQIINSKIQKRISGVSIIPVRYEGDATKSIYIVKIPQSSSAPHMAADKRYYKRFNFQAVAMEDYEVRDLQNRKQKTEITIEDILFTNGGSSHSANGYRYIDYTFRFQVRNSGNIVETMCKLEIHIPKALLNHEISGPLIQYKIRDDGQITVLSVANANPIFQNELTTMVSGILKVKRDNINSLASPGIRIKCYYSSGTTERIFDLLEILTFNGKLIKEFAWQDY